MRSRSIPQDGSPLVVQRLEDQDRLAELLRLEPVNPVDESEDPAVFQQVLRDRTDVDRRVYVLVDPDHTERPVTVVWVALTEGVPRSLDELTDDRAALSADTADTAVFWSIWNVANVANVANRGNVGNAPERRSGGRILIEGAVGLLRSELPGLDTFVTLSPIPELRRWISAQAASDDGVDRTVRPDRDDLLTGAARYLTSSGSDGRPIDPVARFHLGNGARLWRINANADPSDRGERRSFGVMANYRYAPEDRTANRALLRAGTVALSPELSALIDGSPTDSR